HPPTVKTHGIPPKTIRSGCCYLNQAHQREISSLCRPSASRCSHLDVDLRLSKSGCSAPYQDPERIPRFVHSPLLHKAGNSLQAVVHLRCSLTGPSVLLPPCRPWRSLGRRAPDKN